jgi:N-acetyl sugar amidotransferase
MTKQNKKSIFKLKYCKNCILPNTRPNIYFNKKSQMCSVCNSINEKKQKIDWNFRKQKFKKLVKNAKRKNKTYDCIIPVSGGKDSTWQVLTAIKYGLKPLCVTWKTPGRNKVGILNLKNLISLGVDHIDFTINPKIEKYFTKKAFERFGNPLVPMHMAIHALPLNLASKMKIPLILWGENSGIEYGGNQKNLKGEYMTHAWRKVYGVTHGTTAKDWVDKYMNINDLSSYSWVSEKEKKTYGIKEIFLGYYFKWDPQKIYKLSKKSGFKSDTKPKTGYYNYADIDEEFLITVHHWMKWYKYGFSRLWDNLSIEIRNNRLTRKKALEIIKKKGTELPIREIKQFCKYSELSVKKFFVIAEKFRDKEIWKRKKFGNWKIDGFLIDNWKWKNK